MTRFLRATLYNDPDTMVTTCISEEDVIDTLESIRYQAMQPGALVIHEIFEMPDNEIVTATAEAFRRQQVNYERERDQAILFYWAVLQWRRVTEFGMVLMPRPAPLSREEIIVVFEQLAQHPEYGHRRLVSRDETGAEVVIDDGKIKEESDD